MARQVKPPLNEEAAAAADEALGGRPDPNDQAATQEWLTVYDANGGNVEEVDEATAATAEKPVGPCPLAPANPLMDDLENSVVEEVRQRHRDPDLSNSLRKQRQMVAGVMHKDDPTVFFSDNLQANENREDLHPILTERADAVRQIIDLLRRQFEDEGTDKYDVRDMSDKELLAMLSEAGVPPSVQGMDTVAQLRRTNEEIIWKCRGSEDNPEKDSPTEAQWEQMRDNVDAHGELAALSAAIFALEEETQRPATPDDLNDIILYTHPLPKKKPNREQVGDESMPRCQLCRGITEGVQPHPKLAEKEQEIDDRISGQGE